MPWSSDVKSPMYSAAPNGGPACSIRSGRQHDVAIGAVALRRGAVHQRSGRTTVVASWGRSAASRPSEIWLTRCEHRAICASPLGFLPPCGAVAQLGERLNGIQEVEGSTPFGSTLFS